MTAFDHVVQQLESPNPPTETLRAAMASVPQPAERAGIRNTVDAWDAVRSQIQNPTPPPAFGEDGDDYETEDEE